MEGYNYVEHGIEMRVWEAIPQWVSGAKLHKGRIPLKQKLDKSMPPGFSGFYLIEAQIVFKDYGMQSVTLVKYGEVWALPQGRWQISPKKHAIHNVM